MWPMLACHRLFHVIIEKWWCDICLFVMYIENTKRGQAWKLNVRHTQHLLIRPWPDRILSCFYNSIHIWKMLFNDPSRAPQVDVIWRGPSKTVGISHNLTNWVVPISATVVYLFRIRGTDYLHNKDRHQYFWGDGVNMLYLQEVRKILADVFKKELLRYLLSSRFHLLSVSVCHILLFLVSRHLNSKKSDRALP